MTIYSSDPFWSPICYACPPQLKPWLQHRGSLTRRIQQHCHSFQVQTLQQQARRVAFDEALLLGLKPEQLAWSRSVLLLADHQPVVYAHSCCPLSSLRESWQTLKGLGNQPLGVLLFSHPEIKRHRLFYRKYAATALPVLLRNKMCLSHQQIWARRSLFELRGVPLLVTEWFLPDIDIL